MNKSHVYMESKIFEHVKYFKWCLPIENSYILYKLENSQLLIYPGRVDDIEFKVNINVSGGSIMINQKDIENIDRKFMILT